MKYGESSCIGSGTYSGKVEFGLWKGVQEEIRKRVKESDACPFGWSRNRKFSARWVEPDIAVRVRFTAWSSRGRIREGRLIGSDS